MSQLSDAIAAATTSVDAAISRVTTDVAALNQKIADLYLRSHIYGHLDDRARRFRFYFDDVNGLDSPVRLRAQHDAAPLDRSGLDHERWISALLATAKRRHRHNRNALQHLVAARP